MVLPPSASAQSVSLRADIPFDFYVANTLLPSGTYIIQPVNSDVLRFLDASGKSTFLMISGREENDMLGLSRLLFRRYGNTSFLANVYWEGYPTGRIVNKTAREQEVASKFADPKSVVVAGK
jgi:hypothetical protein